MVAPATGTLKYNGYTFDGATHIKCDVQFVYDSEGQFVVAHKHTITVDAVVTELGTDLDQVVLSIRKRLGQAGRSLSFVNKGFGADLIVNNAGNLGRNDIEGGPFPRILSWKPIGDDKACLVTWVVDVTVPVCEGYARTYGVSHIIFGVDYGIDVHGMTVRTLSGHLIMVKPATSTQTADEFRSAFSPEPILGFAREQTWTTSADRIKLSFNIVDTEIASPNAYPPSVTAIDGRHRVQWSMAQAGKFINTMEMTVRPEPSQSPSYAWKMFLTILIARYKRAKANGKGVYLLSLAVEDNLFGMPQNFQASWQTLGAIDDFVQSSGLWTPIGTDWRKWEISLAKTSFHNRGFAGLHDIGQDHVSVTLCDSGGEAYASPNNDSNRKRPAIRAKDVLTNEVPSADQSTLDIESYIEVEEVRDVSLHKIMQAPTADVGSTWDLNDIHSPASDYMIPLDTGKVQHILQESGTPVFKVKFKGRTRRAGHPVPRPSATKLGVAPLQEVSGKFVTRVVANGLGVPVYEAAWDLNYLTTKSPGIVTPPAHLRDGVDGITGKIA
jgi:hypothetical protein